MARLSTLLLSVAVMAVSPLLTCGADHTTAEISVTDEGDMMFNIDSMASLSLQKKGADGSDVGAADRLVTESMLNALMANFSSQISQQISTLQHEQSTLKGMYTNLSEMISANISEITDSHDDFEDQIGALRQNLTSILDVAASRLQPSYDLLFNGTTAAGQWQTILVGNQSSEKPDVPDGAYILMINETFTFRSSPTWRGMYRERIVSEPFAWENGITNSVAADEFDSHQTGHANAAFSGQESITFRTKRNLARSTPNTVELQFKSNVAWTNPVTLRIKMVPIMIDLWE